MDLPVATEPRQLSLRVAACCLLNRGLGFFEFHFAVEHPAQFAVADKIELQRETAAKLIERLDEAILAKAFCGELTDVK